jgi:hypothetical protein
MTTFTPDEVRGDWTVDGSYAAHVRRCRAVREDYYAQHPESIVWRSLDESSEGAGARKLGHLAAIPNELLSLLLALDCATTGEELDELEATLWGFQEAFPSMDIGEFLSPVSLN